MKLLKFPLLVMAVLALASGACAASEATPAEAKAMAVKAAAYLKEVGPEKAFAAFDAKDGPWHDRELFVVVEDSKGMMLAHGTNPGLIGRSVLELKDIDGKPFNHDIVAISTEGWVYFKWQNPVTKMIEPKQQYVIRVGDYLVQVGAFAR